MLNYPKTKMFKNRNYKDKFLIMMSTMRAWHAIDSYQWTSETFCKALSAFQHLQTYWILDLVEKQKQTCLHWLKLSWPGFSSKAFATVSRISHVSQDSWFGKSLNLYLIHGVVQACRIELIPASKKQAQYIYYLSKSGE